MMSFPVISIEEVENELKGFDFGDLIDIVSYPEIHDLAKPVYDIEEQLEQEKDKLWQERQEVISRLADNNKNNPLKEDNFFELAVKYIEKHTGRTIDVILAA